MPILETLLVSASIAIAKSILKVWAADNADNKLPADLGGELVDLVKPLIPEYLAARKVSRELASIGDKAAQSLEFVFRVDGKILDEAEKEEVAKLVASCLQPQAITAEMLVTRDLSPKRLAESFEFHAAHQLSALPDAKRQLFRRVIGEASQSIIDIASKLPSFTERTFAEILHRDRVIEEKADEILENLDRLRAEIRGDPAGDSSRFETEYRRSIGRSLNRMELFGIDIQQSSQSHPLNVAYVSLEVSHNSVSLDGDDDRQENMEDLVIQDVTSLLLDKKRLIVRGPAGSGKTTLLKWIAVQAANRKFAEELGAWNDCVPFFIRLRDFRDGKYPSPGDFVRASAEMIAETMPPGWATQKLAAGDAVVLIDGVDEVSDHHRSEVRTWVRDITQHFPDARVLVTSRPYAVDADVAGVEGADAGWLDGDGFVEADLQSMALPQIENFIEHWHDAVATEVKRQEEVPKLRQLAGALRTTLRENSGLRKLATSPLLCGVICALHRERNQQLPKGRIQLYEKCCEMLLDRRDPERRVELTGHPAFSYPQKRHLLEDLAYYMLRNEWSSISEDRAVACLSRRLAAMQDLPENTNGRTSLRYFVERSGLLREPSQGEISFTHRTFQEFLAAQAAVDAADFGELNNNAINTQWHEVIILAAGLARSDERKELLQNLIQRGDLDQQCGAALHLLAASCQQTAVELDESTKALIANRLQRLVPPRTVREAEQLAEAAGDVVLPFLRFDPNMKKPLAANCVRSLATIGTLEALSILAEYGRSKSIKVWKQIELGRNRFEIGEYVAALRAHTNKLEERLGAWWENSGDYRLAAHVPSVESLKLTDRGIVDLGPLRAATQLKSLVLSANPVDDLSPLADLRRLEVLDLDRTRVEDVSALAQLHALKELRLGHTRVEDVSVLAQLHALNDLRLEHSRVEDVSPLRTLRSLKVLDLGRTRVRNIGPLCANGQLEGLGLQTTRIEEYAPIAMLKELKALDLTNVDIADLSLLSGLSHLAILRIGRAEGFYRIVASLPGGGKWMHPELLDFGYPGLQAYTFFMRGVRVLAGSGNRPCDISPLGNLGSLNTLDLSGRRVADISVLSGLRQLQFLELSGTRIRDLSPLADLSQLQMLGLGGTEICDISPLANLRELRFLALWGTSVDDLSPLAHLRNLHTLDIRDTKVHDLSPISELGHGQLSTLLVSDAELMEVARRLPSVRVVSDWIRYIPR